MATTRTARVAAFAKINLGLRVLRLRTDGFHELRTVFQTISLADELTVSFVPAKTTAVVVEGMPDVADNLAGRAAESLLDSLKLTGAVRIGIRKRIPIGAGLGGGSSDAAAVLLALPALAGRALPLEELLRVAARLGSDVPFFLLGGTALGLGRGEELYPLGDAPPSYGMLLAPGIHISTADAFRALSPTLSQPERKILEFQESVRQRWTLPLVNDFEVPVFAQHPILLQLKRKLLRAGADQALLSGSGSALFGLFNRKETFPGVVQFGGGDGALPFSLLTRSRYRSHWNRHLKLHTEGDLWPPRSLYAR